MEACGVLLFDIITYTTVIRNFYKSFISGAESAYIPI